MSALLPVNELERLVDLERYAILDTEPEQAYDDLTLLAARACQTPFAMVSLIDRDRQWAKSAFGMPTGEMARDATFCAHAILDAGRTFEVHDAHEDRRFSELPWVTGEPHVRFYAGAPLVSPNGTVLGTICVLDRVPRSLTDSQREALGALARQIMAQFELRRSVAVLQAAAEERILYARELEDYQELLEAANEHLLGSGGTDPLTGLPNRHTAEQVVAAEWLRSVRHATALSVALVALDGVAELNRLGGYRAGNDAICVVARALETNRRPSDVVARYGGDRFLVVMHHTSVEEAQLVAERLVDVLEHDLSAFEVATVRIAVAARDESGRSAEALLDAAAEALEDARRTGPGRVAIAGALTGAVVPGI